MRMQWIEARRDLRRYGSRLCLLLVALASAGCSTTATPAATQSDTPHTYYGPEVNGSSQLPETFVIDHSADSTCPVDATTGHPDCTFVQYQLNNGTESVNTSGYFTPLANGILSIDLTFSGGTASVGTLSTYSASAANSWAVELPGQGGLVGLTGQTVVPMASNESCPSLATAQNFQFVTIPNSGDSTGTAYGSVSIGTSGSTVNFSNISQYTVSGSNQPTNASPTSAQQGTCGPTVYGQTISVPVTLDASSSPAATIAIAPSEFLVEDNGLNSSGYQTVMGAGVGAVGLPVPTSTLSTSTLTGTQYVGFIYTTGWGPSSSTVVPASSLVASFGYSPSQMACSSAQNGLPAQNGTMIYGGEFSNNNPSANASANCDIAVDLGVATSNGLYPKAKVWVGSAFPRTASKNQTYPSQKQVASSFSAVAIAGQIQGKYAIFLIGYDPTSLNIVSPSANPTQDWGIYLLQSN